MCISTCFLPTLSRIGHIILLSSIQITGAGGDVSYIDRAGGIELKLGSLLVTTSFFSYDLSGIIASIYNKIHIKISGIIGSDVMGKYGFVINYRNQEVHYDKSFAQAITPPVHKEK